MWHYPINEDLFERFHKYTKIAGVIFILLGLVGIIYPIFMTLATVTFVSWLMIFSGFVAGYFTYLSDKSHYLGWLKSFILIGIGSMIIFYPMTGVGTVGLLLSIYFFMDAFTGISLALAMRPTSGWIWWMINAFISLLIAVLFIADWPFTSLYLIGLLVGFSLFFDGFALLITGSIFKKMAK